MRDITLEDTFRHQFTTRAFATGVPTVLAGTPVLSVLEENNATPITAGVSVSVDRASVVGLNEATIVATAANGYETLKSYSIYISTGTVGGVSVIGEVVGSFTIDKNAKAIWDRILTGATHNVANSAGRRLRTLQESGAVYNGQVWIDTLDGTAGTTAFENGTSDNAVDLIASAKTLAAAVGGGLHDFHIINGSTITLAASTTNESYFGDNWTLALGSQDVAGAYFEGAIVSGVGTSSSEVHYEGCEIGTMSVQNGHFDFCSFSGGTVTHTLASDYNYHNCYSKGDTAPIFTKTAGQAIVVEFHNWSGDITVNDIQAGDTIELGGNFRTIIVAGSGGTVHVHGHYETITSGSFSGTLAITGATKFADAAATLVDTDEIGTAGAGLTNINLPNQTMDITGNLSGSIGSNTELGPAEVNAEVVDVLFTDTDAEPTKGAPGATISIADKIGFLYKAWRNRSTQTATTYSVFNDDATTVDHDATVSDDTTTADRGEMTDGP